MTSASHANDGGHHWTEALWRASDFVLTLSRLRRSSLSDWEREGGAQRRNGEAVKTYADAPTGAVLRARDLRRNATEAEGLVWTALRSAFPNRKWRRQLPVGPYFADFACPAGRLIVELDGGQPMASAEYDEVRSRFLRARGYQVLRFWNNDVLENIEAVLADIANSLSTREREAGAQRRKGEADDPPASSSPSHRLAAGTTLSEGRGRQASRP